MWYHYEKHVCETCDKEFKYSQDTLTLAHGTECPHCGQKFKFEGLMIKPKEK
jgi:DNA-directed RNA polymerase subunit RPC12/RpoP